MQRLEVSCAVRDIYIYIYIYIYNVSCLRVNILYTVRDLRPRWSTRRRAGFSCATLYMQPYMMFSTHLCKQSGRFKEGIEFKH